MKKITKKQADKKIKLLEEQEKQKEKEKAITSASIVTSPLGNSIYSIHSIFQSKNPDLLTIGEELSRQMKSVTEKGNSYLSETILISQAQTLQSLFHYAASRISHSETVSKLQTYSDVAIKANNACRKTLLALNHIKNPTATTFVKQQNNAINQQINQGNIASEQPINLKNYEKKPPNELLNNIEVDHAPLD